MDVRSLPHEEPAVRRFVADLWIPYHRDLAATVADHTLADDVDLVAAETEHRLDWLAADDSAAWVAVDATTGGDAGDGGNATPLEAAELAGFVTASVDEAPPVFDRPDRVVVGDFYVRESNRGSGLARDLLDSVVEYARDRDCLELALDVDLDNERALTFYEKVGFEVHRHRMRAPVDEL